MNLERTKEGDEMDEKTKMLELLISKERQKASMSFEKNLSRLHQLEISFIIRPFNKKFSLFAKMTT